ncbi:MAG TPA: VapC toxin family PIN domain ribonuclease [Chloroflexi bacterium]|nr:VapC toxin family PIN domain ribonuclease [Chloroflexota bacterium]HBY09069.1 VapC toxin family PIN domain ribonuclease [Chloroflexota bacterium]
MSLPTMMNTLLNPSKMIFVDTSAFLALLTVSDSFHIQAKTQWRALLENTVVPITNNYVLIETIAILQNRHGLALVQNLQIELLPLLEVDWLGETQHNEAIYQLFAANRRRLSLVDCSSFATMRRRGIRQVFTFDPHFGEQGFEVVPAI